MASLRHLGCLFVLLTSTVLSQAAPTAQEIIAKARSAALKEPTSADQVKGLHFEVKVTDLDKKSTGLTILDLAAPQSRRQISYSPDFFVESITATNGLEGWVSTHELRPGGRQENKIIEFKQVARMKDSTVSDLSFFQAPAPNAGSAELLGTNQVDGKKVYSIEYKYLSGFSTIRHFDTRSYELVATDEIMPDGKLQRQVVKELSWVAGISFAKREEIYIDGKKIAEAVYEKISINPEVSEASFAFPVR